MRRFQDMAYGYSYSILGDFHSAQDAAQEAFLDAYRQLPSLRDPKAFPGWFRRIVFKHCDRITRRKRMTSVPLDDSKACELTYPDSADIIAQAEEREQVLSAVRSLPEGHRTVTTLFYINGYSQREIADFLELPVTTVKKRIYDSRQRLKERMVDLVSESLRRHSLSSDFTDIVVRKAASLSDLERASAFIDYHARHHPEHFKSVDAAAKAGVFVVGREGEVSGAGYFGEAAWSIGSTIIRRALIDEIGGEGKGVPDPAFLMGCKGALKLAKEQGINIAVVHGSQFDHGLCGFVPCFYYAVATLSTDRARQVQTRATVREVRDADEAEEGWRAFMTDPYSTKGWGLIGPAPVTHVVEDRNEVVGYLAVHPDGNRRARKYGLPFGFMPTVTLKTREAALAAIKLHGDLAAEAGGDEIVVLQSHMTEITKTILSLGGRYVLRPSCDEIGLDAEVVAVTDFLGLTKELEDRLEQKAFLDSLQAATGLSPEEIGPRLQTHAERASQRRTGQLLQAAIHRLHAKANEGDLIGAEEELAQSLQELRRSRGVQAPEPYSLTEFERDILTAGEGLSTGYQALDKHCLVPQGAITIVAGRPGHGKTTLKLNMLLRMLERYEEQAFFFFSYEESRRALAVKLIMAMAGVVLHASHNVGAYVNYLKEKRGSEPAIEQALERYEELTSSGRLWLVDSRLTAEDLAATIGHLASGREIGAVFVDYIQKIGLQRPGGAEKRYLEIKRVSELLLEQAVSCDLPIILGAQFRRGSGGEPGLDNLRESGDIEQDANLVIGLYNDTEDKRQQDTQSQAERPQEIALELTVLKNRNGAAGGRAMLSLHGRTYQIKPSSSSY